MTRPNGGRRSPSRPHPTDGTDTMTDNAVKGPASYFPSIEKKYGRPVAEWKDLIRTSPLTKHMELVGWLKSEHGLGHGHANALTAHTLAEDGAR
ncbi:hypothetical protein SSIG_03781 [Streptomyces filamentosus NRRL 11379]|nr:hypothetical protein SSIG_03781 [Streptomyces filamentosus NRRL 11379]